MFTRSISIRPEAVSEDLKNFWVTLTLRGARGVWFSSDPEGKQRLKHHPHVPGDSVMFAGETALLPERTEDETDEYLILVPEVSATEETTIYLHSEEHIPDQKLRVPPSKPPMTDEEAETANLLDEIESEP